MNAETLLACLKTLQISRGKEILRVRDIKELPGKGYNYTMDYNVINSRHQYMETSFNNIIPKQAFLDYVRDNPDSVNTTSTAGLKREVPKLRHQNVNEVKLSPDGRNIPVPNKAVDLENPEPLVVKDQELTEPQGTENTQELTGETVTVLTSTGQSTVTKEYHENMIKEHGEEDLPYTVIG